MRTVRLTKYSRLKGAGLLALHYTMFLVLLALSLITAPLIATYAVPYRGLDRLLALIVAFFVMLSVLRIHVRALAFSHRPDVRGVETTPEAIPAVGQILATTLSDLRAHGYVGEGFTHVQFLGYPELATSDLGGKRTLYLGLPVLQHLSQDELMAVLAHEYSHHESSAMSYHRALWRCIETSIRFEIELQRAFTTIRDKAKRSYFYAAASLLGGVTVIIPYSLLILYFRTIIRAATSGNYSFEYAADARAALLYGPETFCAALHSYYTLSFEWQRFVRSKESPRNDIFTTFTQFRTEKPWNKSERLKFEIFCTQSGSRHPSYKERIAAVKHIVSTGGALQRQHMTSPSPSSQDSNNALNLLGKHLHDDTVQHISLEREAANLSQRLREYIMDLDPFDQSLPNQDPYIIGKGLALLMEHFTEPEMDNVMDLITSEGSRRHNLYGLACVLTCISDADMMKHAIEFLTPGAVVSEPFPGLSVLRFAFLIEPLSYLRDESTNYEKTLGDVEDLIVSTSRKLQYKPDSRFQLKRLRKEMFQ